MKSLRQSTCPTAFALFALVLQIAFGFGHVHDQKGRSGLIHVVHVEFLDHHANQDHGPVAPAPSRDHNDHDCQLCKIINGLVSLVPEAITGEEPVFTVSARKTVTANDAVFSSFAGRYYRARAPPSKDPLSL